MIARTIPSIEHLKKILCIIFLFHLIVLLLTTSGLLKLIIFEIITIVIFILYLTSPINISIDFKIFVQKLILSLYGKEKINVSKKLRYKRILNSRDIKIYTKRLLSDEILALNNDMFLMCNNSRNVIKIVNKQMPAFQYKIHVNEKKFKGLIKNSVVNKGLILPYQREYKKNKFTHAWRIILLTDKGQIYHNYPNRNIEYAGFSKTGDLIRFEESAIWDIPDRKYPTKNENHEEYECFYPGLPSEAYEYFPLPNDDFQYRDRFGNGGFPRYFCSNKDGRQIKISRFYIPVRSQAANPFNFMGGLEFDEKYTILGTYASNSDIGARICVFATSDGGRNWFNKYEFGDLGEYSFRQGIGKIYGKNWGNNISFGSTLNQLTEGEVTFRKRNLILPDENNKEPKNLFLWEKERVIIKIETINGITNFQTNEPHGLKDGNIIAFRSNKKKLWFINNDVGENSCGNGILFKVEVIDEDKFVVHEFVANPYNNIPCRHVHHISKVKDGFLLGTGEIYPNGWIFFFQQKKKDNGFVVQASEELPVFRLNSAEKSVQRTMGILWNEETNEITIASDHDIHERPRIDVPSRRTIEIRRNSLGLFKGRLADIDDFSKFVCVLELNEPTYFFKKLNSMILICGQRGEMLYSLDNGRLWKQVRLSTPFESCTGISNCLLLCGNYLIETL